MVNVLEMVVSHKWADVEELECATLGDSKSVINELYSKPEIEECAIISTCNRVELIVVPNTSLKRARSILKEFAQPRVDIDLDEIARFFAGEKLLRHLLRLSAGLESLVVGEDQILGQVKDLYNEAKDNDTLGPVLSLAFEKAINIGKKVRNETKINDGFVSMGSVAVDLAEKILGDLEDKKALLVGAGEMASIMAKCLRDRNIEELIITNRTLERAKELAKEVEGKPIGFDEYGDYLSEIDILMTATGAPHPIIKKEDLEKNKKNDLVIIDISNPRDVEEDVSDLENVSYHDIDGLRGVTEQNKKKREQEARQAEEIIAEELDNLLDQYKEKEAEDLIASLHERAHKIRIRERDKALNKLSLNNEDKQIIEDLTRSIVNKILSDPTHHLKRAASNGNKETLESMYEMFNLREKDEDSGSN
ncbi:glutamyl-tRNA reductase [archaeon SCG-AAA382B04]|nr:glutamyl-tRNA reductase [archaeon SCG-AAA382B04]